VWEICGFNWLQSAPDRFEFQLVVTATKFSGAIFDRASISAIKAGLILVTLMLLQKRGVTECNLTPLMADVGDAYPLEVIRFV